MSQLHRIASRLIPFLGVLALGPAQAQTFEYDVTDLGPVPGAYITYTSGLNDHGVVVGMALFIPGGLKAYTWSASQGYVILPQPPGISSYGAVDINNAGVIAGDGGGDSGEIWRYTNGTYEMLGVLPGLPIPRAAAIGATGSIAGTCLGTQFYTPYHSFIATPGLPMVSIFDNSYANHINDFDQITGSAPGSLAYRSTPGVGIDLLPAMGVRNYASGYSINNTGNVTGVAWSSAQHDGVPFHFSDGAGMQEIGNFGGRAFAVDINDFDEVIGEFEPAFGTSRRAWVWSAAEGDRYLNDLIDPALNLWLKNAKAINNAGQILCYPKNGDLRPILLTPHMTDPVSYCSSAPNSAGQGCVIGWDGTPSVVANVLRLFAHDSVPGESGVFYYGPQQISVPFGDGVRCVGSGATGTFRMNPIQQADALGEVVYPVNLTNQPAASGAGQIQPGATWNFQYWYRDPQGPGGSGFNFSNGLEVVFGP